MLFRRAALTLAIMMIATAAHAAELVVHKTPWCGCCAGWVEHMRDAGFDVVVHEHDDLTEVRADAGVPDSMMSCHTALIDGYAIEGHVPAADVKRLLSLRPEITGIAAPGMPIGSPGMEMGDRKETYQIVAFKDGAAVGVFATH